MEKKHISIFGSCVSRHLFNTSILEETFVVDRYAYQVCPWDALTPGLDIPKEEIERFYSEEFTARMIWYDLSKVALKEIEAVKSEYLLVDLYTLIQNVVVFSLDGKKVRAQFSYDRYSNFLNAISQDVSWKNVTVEKFKCREIDDEIYLNGLKDFAAWVNANFEGEKVIINIPPFAVEYLDTDNNCKRYSDQSIEYHAGLLEWIKNMSQALSSYIPGSKILNLCDQPSIAQFGIYDNIDNLIPTNVHYTDEDYLRYSQRFLDVVGVEYPKMLFGSLSHLGYECVRFRNLYLKTRAQNKITAARTPMVQPEKLYVFETNLNDYVSRIDNLEDFIIVMTAKDEAKHMLSKFTEREKLGLSMDLIFRGSYIAVVDKSRSFVYEKADESKQTFEYAVDGCTFSLVSGGYNSGNTSSIIRKLGEEEKEFSLNRRGLNIALFNSKTFELVDAFKCDTHLDSELKVDSRYIANMLLDYKIRA